MAYALCWSRGLKTRSLAAPNGGSAAGRLANCVRVCVFVSVWFGLWVSVYGIGREGERKDG